MKFKKILISAHIIRYAGLFFSSTLAFTLITPAVYFPFKSVVDQFNVPELLVRFASFDGAHYILIADKGYWEYQHAFFPLYPILMTYVGRLFHGNYVISGLALSHVCFIFGTYFFYKVFHRLAGVDIAIKSLLILMFFPTAFYFSAVYTESLFLLITSASLWLLMEKKYFSAGALGVLSGLTRVQGVFLIILFIGVLLHVSKAKNKLKTLEHHKLLLFSPIIGLGMYMTYLWQKTGDPLNFLHLQWAFGASRSSSLILLPQVYFRYLKIFLTSDFNFPYLIAIFEFCMTTLALIATFYVTYRAFRNKNIFEWSLSLFSLAHILLPPLTGTFSSMPRYVLFAWALIYALAHLKNRYFYPILVSFAFFGIFLTSLFLQSYFIS